MTLFQDLLTHNQWANFAQGVEEFLVNQSVLVRVLRSLSAVWQFSTQSIE